MRIAILNQKGGVGKTTVVLLLTAVLREAQYDVAIDDRDEQGSARFFAGRLGLSLLDPAKPPAYIVTDTPGRLRLDDREGAELRELVASSDRLVLVTEKSSTALHGTFPMAKIITDNKRRDAKACVLFNKVRAGTTTGQKSGADIARELGLPALSVELPLSAAYDNASQGEGLAAVTGKRRDDLMRLALEVLK